MNIRVSPRGPAVLIGLAMACVSSAGPARQVKAVPGAVPAARSVAAVPSEELDHQFAALKLDLQRRATFEKLAAETQHPAALIQPADHDPADVVLRRTMALLADLQTSLPAVVFDSFAARLSGLRETAASVSTTNAVARRELFDRACLLRREIAFSNPLLNFDRLLFIKRHRSIYEHMCDQYYGITARPGGGLYVLHDPFGPNPTLRDVLARSVVENGRLKGRPLKGGNGAAATLHYDGVRRLSGDATVGGSFLSPAVSYDGGQILFAYVEATGSREQEIHTDASRGHWDAGRCYHIFKVNADGTGLRQLTDGTWNDFDPCWLPNDRIAFISERRGGYLRCGRACPLYNLYDMAPDGSGINLLSFHDSNEWNPSVTHDGRIVWTRWDYVDRHGCVAHVPWITRLDGTDPRALHGNFAPRPNRADMELGVRPIPGSPRFVATAAPHHGQAFGSLVVIDPRVEDDDAMGPVRRLTPEVAFPESQGGRQVYGTPWPLSETYHLCVYDDAMNGTRKPRGNGDYGIYLVDAFGNKELIYRDPEIGCLSPMPLRPTPRPPVAPTPSLAAAPPAAPGSTGEGTMAVVNVYDTLSPWPATTKIKELRIFQLLPCSVPSGGDAPHQTGKRIAEATDSIVPARWVLGTVPIEVDGSAHFKVPAYRELFFQLIDERGMAVQSMRSGTAVRHGEKLVCAGCHEAKHRTATSPAAVPLALRREPSVPKPDVDGSNPFSYARLVQPVLDRHCVECHAKTPDKAPSLAREPVRNQWFASYNNLVKYAFTSYGAQKGWNDPRWYRTTPGKFGAHASKLVEILDRGHFDVKLSPEEFHRITLWLDSSSLFYGVFEKEPGQAQLRGEVVRATLE